MSWFSGAELKCKVIRVWKLRGVYFDKGLIKLKWGNYKGLCGIDKFVLNPRVLFIFPELDHLDVIRTPSNFTVKVSLLLEIRALVFTQVIESDNCRTSTCFKDN